LGELLEDEYVKLHCGSSGPLIQRRLCVIYFELHRGERESWTES